VTDYDRRIVDLYDTDNPDGPDHDFYRALADELGAESILDIGCGTGILTVTLARPGRTVVGIDPSEAMIDYARRRPGAGTVTWTVGDSRDIRSNSCDYAVMTGNVAQHIPDDAWARTLGDVRRALQPGGVLAFESRNPLAEAWRTWTTEPTTRHTRHGDLREWTEASEIAPGQVQLTSHSHFIADDKQVTDVALLTFRSGHTIRHQLEAAGFIVEAVYGDWNRTPFTDDAQLMVFVARG